MDYHGLTRKELQSLCKKHGIRANTSNASMADALKSMNLIAGSGTGVPSIDALMLPDSNMNSPTSQEVSFQSTPLRSCTRSMVVTMRSRKELMKEETPKMAAEEDPLNDQIDPKRSKKDEIKGGNQIPGKLIPTPFSSSNSYYTRRSARLRLAKECPGNNLTAEETLEKKMFDENGRKPMVEVIELSSSLGSFESTEKNLPPKASVALGDSKSVKGSTQEIEVDIEIPISDGLMSSIEGLKERFSCKTLRITTAADEVHLFPNLSGETTETKAPTEENTVELVLSSRIPQAMPPSIETWSVDEKFGSPFKKKRSPRKTEHKVITINDCTASVKPNSTGDQRQGFTHNGDDTRSHNPHVNVDLSNGDTSLLVEDIEKFQDCQDDPSAAEHQIDGMSLSIHSTKGSNEVQIVEAEKLQVAECFGKQASVQFEVQNQQTFIIVSERNKDSPDFSATESQETAHEFSSTRDSVGFRKLSGITTEDCVLIAEKHNDDDTGSHNPHVNVDLSNGDTSLLVEDIEDIQDCQDDPSAVEHQIDGMTLSFHSTKGSNEVRIVEEEKLQVAKCFGKQAPVQFEVQNQQTFIAVSEGNKDSPDFSATESQETAHESSSTRYSVEFLKSSGITTEDSVLIAEKHKDDDTGSHNPHVNVDLSNGGTSLLVEDIEDIQDCQDDPSTVEHQIDGMTLSFHSTKGSNEVRIEEEKLQVAECFGKQAPVQFEAQNQQTFIVVSEVNKDSPEKHESSTRDSVEFLNLTGITTEDCVLIAEKHAEMEEQSTCVHVNSNGVVNEGPHVEELDCESSPSFGAWHAMPSSPSLGTRCATPSVSTPVDTFSESERNTGNASYTKNKDSILRAVVMSPETLVDNGNNSKMETDRFRNLSLRKLRTMVKEKEVSKNHVRVVSQAPRAEDLVDKKNTVDQLMNLSLRKLRMMVKEDFSKKVTFT